MNFVFCVAENCPSTTKCNVALVEKSFPVQFVCPGFFLGGGGVQGCGMRSLLSLLILLSVHFKWSFLWSIPFLSLCLREEGNSNIRTVALKRATSRFPSNNTALTVISLLHCLLVIGRTLTSAETAGILFHVVPHQWKSVLPWTLLCSRRFVPEKYGQNAS